MDNSGKENEKAKKYAEWKCRKKICQLSVIVLKFKS